MTKQDVIRRISQQTGIDDQISRSVVESFFEVVKTAVSQGETVYVRQFGSFGPKQRAEKVARHIKDNTAILVAAHAIPYFKPSVEFTNQVKGRDLAVSPKKAKS